MSLSLPEKKILDIQNKCQSLISNLTTSARTVAGLIGTLEVAHPAIWPAPLHYSQLQIQLIKSLQASWDNYAHTNYAHTKLQWWLHIIATVKGNTINPPAPKLYITSDASKAGWGACCQNLTANVRLSPLEAKDHINVIELKAVFSCNQDLSQTPFQHQCVSPHGQYHSRFSHMQQSGYPFPSASQANSRTMAVVPSKKSILITAQHFPGKINKVADGESRGFYNSSERQIDPQVIQSFLRGCSVDLFASRLTALLSTYANWKQDSGATYTDTMTLDWSLLKGYAFPPSSLIAPVLK